MKNYVHVRTQNQWNFVTEKLDYEWREGTWDFYKKNSNICLDELLYCSIELAVEEGYNIISFEEWCRENNYTPKLTKEDLIEGEFYSTKYPEQGTYVFKNEIPFYWTNYLYPDNIDTKERFGSDGKETDFKESNGFTEFSIASNQEKQHLEACIKVNTFIPLEEVNNSQVKFNAWNKGNGKYLYYIKSETDFYGFNLDGEWINLTGESLNLHGFSPATEEEVKERLLKYVKEKYPNGIKYKELNPPFNTKKVSLNSFDYYPDNDQLTCGYTIYQNGKWAEIIESPVSKDQEEFVLPKKWCIFPSNQKETEIVFDWAKKKNPKKYPGSGYYTWHKDVSFDYLGRYRAYEETKITFEQFKKYVMKDEEAKFEKGKWYKSNDINPVYRKCSVTGKYCKYEELIDVKYRKDSGKAIWENVIEASLEEIQQYLPEDHPDKISNNVPKRLSFYVKYTEEFTEDLYNKLWEWSKKNSEFNPRGYLDTYKGLLRHRYYIFDNWSLNNDGVYGGSTLSYGVDNNSQECKEEYSIQQVKDLIGYKETKSTNLGDYIGRYIKALVDNPNGGIHVKSRDIGKIISSSMIDFPNFKHYKASFALEHPDKYELLPEDYSPVEKWSVGTFVVFIDSDRAEGYKYTLGSISSIISNTNNYNTLNILLENDRWLDTGWTKDREHIRWFATKEEAEKFSQELLGKSVLKEEVDEEVCKLCEDHIIGGSKCDSKGNMCEGRWCEEALEKYNEHQEANYPELFEESSVKQRENKRIKIYVEEETPISTSNNLTLLTIKKRKRL